MGHIVTTIIPIFSLVVLGIIARSRGFLPPEFLGPANRLVYYPAMVFRAIANASLTRQFNPTVIWLTLVALVVLFSISGMTMPLVIDRSLQILSGMALPLALLIIGGSLSLQLMRSRMAAVLGTCLLKLLVLPALGVVFGGVLQAILTRVLADDETGGTPAFETHGPAAVGPARVPSDVIKFASSADDGFAWIHGNGTGSAFSDQH